MCPEPDEAALVTVGMVWGVSDTCDVETSGYDSEDSAEVSGAGMVYKLVRELASDTGQTVVETAMVLVTTTAVRDSAGQLVIVEAQEVTVWTVVV